ncbi:MvaI/BcnI family restriction endonuclease [Oceanisphaera sp. W20_SRM_FM3]|uniref:MvaI/BcnI family restriction endonuclease n=1 Tax=Oceanisphaera sp. W20_SRM_FM3 TaxID=3240267 RepID=UPI003F9C036A
MKKATDVSLNRLKQRAKDRKKELGIKHADALKAISYEEGFSSWKELQESYTVREQAQLAIPFPSLNFTADVDVDMSVEDFDTLDQERHTDLDLNIKSLVIENKKTLASLGVEFSVFEPTITGLKKSILDATQTVRTHFELEVFHNYELQQQGPEHKIIKKSILLLEDKEIKSTVSLYRPMTKNGDPRMWFRNLSSLASAQDIIGIIISDDTAYLINLCTTNLALSIKNGKSIIGNFLNNYIVLEGGIADELLQKIRKISKSKIRSLKKGDTSIGYTIEKLLGIEANSSKAPDYKGIEIKSGRGSRTRTTLFAQVADWSISPCKRSAEILNKYGYERDDEFKLYCTLSTQRENSQGLHFIYDEKNDVLQEWHINKDLVAVWPGSILRSRLKEKHSETFWIEATSKIIDGTEHFTLISITHTKSPVLSQLMPLIESGVVTMDHLIKRNKKGRVSEKGPLFKINKRDLELLFPKPVKYTL